MIDDSLFCVLTPVHPQRSLHHSPGKDVVPDMLHLQHGLLQEVSAGRGLCGGEGRPVLRGLLRPLPGTGVQQVP